MRLQQLLYVKEVARCRSMNRAALRLYISQPSLSEAIRDLEKEFGITIFERSRRGVTLTVEGIEFLHLADKIIADTEALQHHYFVEKGGDRPYLQISCQHYASVVEAIIQLINEWKQDRYTLSLKETETLTALEDVYLKKSAFCIVVMTEENRHYLQQVFEKWDLIFHELVPVQPHIFINRHHPLAGKAAVTADDLSPYPLLQFGQTAATELAGEELFTLKDHDKVIYSYDRGTTNNILANTDCFNIGTGYLIPAIIPESIISIPVAGIHGQASLGFVVLRTQKQDDITKELLRRIRDSLYHHYPGTGYKA